MLYHLLRKGLEPKMAFDIMEAVRKGKVAKGGFKPGWEEACGARGAGLVHRVLPQDQVYVPQGPLLWPDLMSAIRLMWFKLYRPAEFYAVLLHCAAMISTMRPLWAVRLARARMEAVKRRLKEEKNAKDEDVLVSLQLVNENAVLRVCVPAIELGKSRGNKYIVEDGKVRLPFCALKGVGGTAAALAGAGHHRRAGVYLRGGLQQATGVTSAVLESLRTAGVLADLPESSQVSFF